MCSFFKWVRILPELHKMSAKLVDFCGVVPQELIGAMCWPTAGGGILVPAAVFCLFWRVLKSPKEYK